TEGFVSSFVRLAQLVAAWRSPMLARSLTGFIVTLGITSSVVAQVPPAFDPARNTNGAARLIKPVASTSDDQPAPKPPSVLLPTGLEHTQPCATELGFGAACPGECGNGCYPDSCGWVRGEWL